MRRRTTALLASVSTCCLAAIVVSRTAGADEGWKGDPLLKEIIAWVPRKTETIVVDRRVATLEKNRTGSRFYDVLDPQIPSGAVCALDEIGDGAFFDQLVGRRTLLFVEANNGYVLPPGPAGTGRYQGCQFIVFRAEDADVVKIAFNKMLEKADQKEVLRSVDVGHFNEEREETFLVASPKSSVLLVATDREYLARVLDNISAPHQTVLGRPQWKHVKEKAEVWAIRFGKKKTVLDPGLTGMVYQYVPNNDKVVTIHYTTTSPTSERTIRGMWTLPEPWNAEPSVRQIEEGVFEIRHELRKEGVIIGFWIYLANHLGCETVF